MEISNFREATTIAMSILLPCSLARLRLSIIKFVWRAEWVGEAPQEARSQTCNGLATKLPPASRKANSVPVLVKARSFGLTNKNCCQFYGDWGQEHGTRIFSTLLRPPVTADASCSLHGLTECNITCSWIHTSIHSSIDLFRSPAERKSRVRPAASSAFLLPCLSMAWESSRWTALVSLTCSSLHLV